MVTFYIILSTMITFACGWIIGYLTREYKGNRRSPKTINKVLILAIMIGGGFLSGRLLAEAVYETGLPRHTYVAPIPSQLLEAADSTTN